MTWNLDIVAICVAGMCIEGLWVVDESSHADAWSTDKTPYLMVGVDLRTHPEPQQVEWVASSQLAEYANDGGYFVTGKMIDPLTAENKVVYLTGGQVKELSRLMDGLAEGVTVSAIKEWRQDRELG